MFVIQELMNFFLLLLICDIAVCEQRSHIQDVQTLQDIMRSELRGETFWENFFYQFSDRYRDMTKIIIKKQMNIITNRKIGLLTETVDYLETTFQKQLYSIWATFVAVTLSFALYLYFK